MSSHLPCWSIVEQKAEFFTSLRYYSAKTWLPPHKDKDMQRRWNGDCSLDLGVNVSTIVYVCVSPGNLTKRPLLLALFQLGHRLRRLLLWSQKGNPLSLSLGVHAASVVPGMCWFCFRVFRWCILFNHLLFTSFLISHSRHFLRKQNVFPRLVHHIWYSN